MKKTAAILGAITARGVDKSGAVINPPVPSSVKQAFPRPGHVPVPPYKNGSGPVGDLSAYGNPFRAIHNLVPMRIDQGVDYGGTGNIYSLGSGVVTNVAANGWPGKSFIGIRLTDGPYAGKYVYFAENIVPHVRVGQKVTKDTVIGVLQAGYPFSESGFAQAPGTGWPEAHVLGQYSTGGDPGAHTSAIGIAWNNVLRKLGAPSGIITQGGILGSIPKDYRLPSKRKPGPRVTSGLASRITAALVKRVNKPVKRTAAVPVRPSMGHTRTGEI